MNNFKRLLIIFAALSLSLWADSPRVLLSTYGYWPLCGTVWTCPANTPIGQYILFVKIVDPAVTRYEYSLQITTSEGVILKSGVFSGADSGYGYASVIVDVGAKITNYTYKLTSLKETEVLQGP